MKRTNVLKKGILMSVMLITLIAPQTVRAAELKKVEVEKEVVEVHLPKQLMESKVESPVTQKEFEAEFVDMVTKREFTRTIQYTPTFKATKDIKILNDGKTIWAAFAEVRARYPEYLGYTNVSSIGILNRGGTTQITLTISTKEEFKETKNTTEMLDIFELKAKQVVKDLQTKGKLTEKQTEKEKARVLYTWVIENTKYLNDGKGDSFTGYGQIVQGTAVCQGYVSTYNYLLRIVGVEDVRGVAGYANGGKGVDKHIWTEAILDGERVIIDTTFGDPVSTQGDTIDYKYFDITEDALRKTHMWETK